MVEDTKLQQIGGSREQTDKQIKNDRNVEFEGNKAGEERKYAEMKRRINGGTVGQIAGRLKRRKDSVAKV